VAANIVEMSVVVGKDTIVAAVVLSVGINVTTVVVFPIVAPAIFIGTYHIKTIMNIYNERH